MKTFPSVLCGLLLSQLSFCVSATTIGYEVGIGPGGLWQYHYQVSGRSFQANDGFSILFAVDKYSGLEDTPPQPSNGDWSAISLQPDPLLPDPGRYDALALVDAARLTDLFSISFNWLGSGQPGSQPFEIYTLDQNGNVSGIPETGFTEPLAPPVETSVPEPGSLSLLMVGCIGLFLRHRRQKARPS